MEDCTWGSTVRQSWNIAPNSKVAVVVIRGRKAIHESECEFEFEFEFECECEFKSEWVIWDLSLLNEGVNVRLC